MASDTPLEALSATASLAANDIAEILRERGWLRPDHDMAADDALRAWCRRTADLLDPQVKDRAALAELLALVFNYDAAIVLRDPANQAVLAREGSRDVIRELANRVLDGRDIDSDRFKEIVDGIKTALPQRSRELFHPVRLALAGRAGEGELDRVILLLDSAARIEFVIQVKGTRRRMLEFCVTLD